jgi:catechol 2,3-dioxygenase-like lactoylglutathione lyase family enzyme
MLRLVFGVHDIRIPISDAWASRDWYMSVLGFEPVLDLQEADGLVGVVLRHPSDVTIGLHLDPRRASALKGFALLVLAVPDRAALEECGIDLNRIGQPHSPIAQGHLGWYLDVPDPDGILIRFHTQTSFDAEEA